MKIFKSIYYPILAMILVVLISISFVNTTNGAGETSLSNTEIKKIETSLETLVKCSNESSLLSSITSEMRTAGVSVGNDSTPIKNKTDSNGDPNPQYGMNVANYYTTTVDDKKTINPTILNQNARILQETSNKITKDESKLYVDYEITNKIIAVPGSVSKARYEYDQNNPVVEGEEDANRPNFGDAVLVMANYDRSKIVESGSVDINKNLVGNLISVSAVMNSIKTLVAQTEQAKNDFIFVFTQGGESGNLGAYAFMHQFKGFDNIVDRIKTVINFSATGKGGLVVLSATEGDGTAMARSFINTVSEGYVSSLQSMVSRFLGNDGSDLTAIEGISAYEISGMQTTKDDTFFDTMKNIDYDFYHALALTAKNTVNYFSSYDLSSLDAKTTAVGYYNYLGKNTVYSTAWVYVLGAITLALVVASILIPILMKNKKWISLLRGAGVWLCSIVASMACYLIFYLLMLMMSGFGIIDVHAIWKIVFARVELIVCAIAIMLALATAFCSLFKKLLKANTNEVAQGNSLVVGIVSALVGFIFPEIALLLVIVAVVATTTLLMEILFDDKLESKFGFRLRLFVPYLLPIIAIIPWLFTEVYLLSAVAPLMMLPIFLIPFVMYGGYVLPYVGYYGAKLLDLIFVRKGKRANIQANVNGERIANAKTNPFRGFGITIVALLSCVAMVVIGVTTEREFGNSASTNYSYQDNIYKDSIVYRLENGKTTAEISDLDFYKYVSKVTDEFEWNSERQMYVLNDAPPLPIDLPLVVNSDENNKKRFIVSTSEESIYDYVIKLSGFGAGNIKAVRIKKPDPNNSNNTIELSYDVSHLSSEEITLIVPSSKESGFAFELDGEFAKVDIEVEQRCLVGAERSSNSLWQKINYEYSDNDDLMEHIRMTLIMKSRMSFTY